MADQRPLSRVYSNALSSYSYMNGDLAPYLGDCVSFQSPDVRRLYSSAASGHTTDGRLRPSTRMLGTSLGSDSPKVRRELSFELNSEACTAPARSREPAAEAELLPVSRYGAAMYESVVFMPPAYQTEGIVSTPPGATAHMIVSNGPDDASEGQVQAYGNKAMDCSCRTAMKDSLIGELAVVGNLATLQKVTLRHMEDTGLLDLTLERAAQSLNVRLATLKVHLRVLGVSKWPSRKRSSIRKLLRHCPDLQGTPKQRVQFFGQSVGELRSALEIEYKNVQCATPAKKALIRHLRQRWYKSREYRHKQQTPPCGTSTPTQTTPTRPAGDSAEPGHCPGSPACKGP